MATYHYLKLTPDAIAAASGLDDLIGASIIPPTVLRDKQRVSEKTGRTSVDTAANQAAKLMKADLIACGMASLKGVAKAREIILAKLENDAHASGYAPDDTLLVAVDKDRFDVQHLMLWKAVAAENAAIAAARRAQIEAASEQLQIEA